MATGTLSIEGRKFVVIAKSEYDWLKRKVHGTDAPPTPRKLPGGNYPALEYVRASIARDIIRDRKAKGWSQEELARRAGIRRETLGRIELGKHAPTKRILAKIDKALAVA
jgi:ribosome-binding protein aMBF1 (putative translation factor)